MKMVMLSMKMLQSSLSKRHKWVLQRSPTRRAKFKENIWSLLLLLKQKEHHRERLNIRINNYSNTLAVETAKNHRMSPFFYLRDSLLVGILDVMWFEISLVFRFHHYEKKN